MLFISCHRVRSTLKKKNKLSGVCDVRQFSDDWIAGAELVGRQTYSINNHDSNEVQPSKQNADLPGLQVIFKTLLFRPLVYNYYHIRGVLKIIIIIFGTSLMYTKYISTEYLSDVSLVPMATMHTLQWLLLNILDAVLCVDCSQPRL